MAAHIPVTPTKLTDDKTYARITLVPSDITVRTTDITGLSTAYRSHIA